jgi:hypothetical protein
LDVELAETVPRVKPIVSRTKQSQIRSTIGAALRPRVPMVEL